MEKLDKIINKSLKELIENRSVGDEDVQEVHDRLLAEKALENLSKKIDLKHEGGEHLGVIHSWIQRKFVNGDNVIWGSNDFLSGSFTVRNYENLAIEIAEAAINEYKGLL